MTEAHSRASTQNSKFIKATPETLYRAFTDPAALAVWFAPGDMTGEVHRFDDRVGGGYQMSLYYPSSEQTSQRVLCLGQTFSAPCSLFLLKNL